MKLLWSSILLKVNNRLDLITTTLVGKVWKDICHDKRYFHICHYEEDIMNKIDIYLKERSKQLRKKQMNNVCVDTNTNNSTLTSSSFIYPQTICSDVNGYYVTPTNTDINIYNNIVSTNTDVNNYYITPINSPQFSNETINNHIDYSSNHIYNEIVPVVPVTTIPLSPISIISSEEDGHVNNSIINFSNEIIYTDELSYISLNY